MAKSKQQKQQEAIERLRKNLVNDRDVMLKKQPGGEWYKNSLKYEGRETADKEAADALRLFKKKCEAAQCDTSGNPNETNIVNAGLMYKMMHGLN